MFKKFDVDGNLLLDRDELTNFINEFFLMFDIRMNLNESQLNSCFEEIDVNGDGKIQPSELQKFAIKYVEVLIQAFDEVIANEKEDPFNDSSSSSSSSESLKTEFKEKNVQRQLTERTESKEQEALQNEVVSKLKAIQSVNVRKSENQDLVENQLSDRKNV